MEIYLIRHTRPDIAKGICYGQSDIALADSFQAETEILSNKLSSLPSIIYSSPLVRCKRLSQELAEPETVLLFKDELQELNFGSWELKPWSSLAGKSLDLWMNDFVNTKCPNGESYLELVERSTAVWSEIIANTEHKSIGIVCHSGVIRAIISNLLGISLEKSFRLSFDYGSVSKVSIHHTLPTIEYLNR